MEDLSAQVGVKPRQLMNYLATLRNYGFNIDTSVGIGGGIGPLRQGKRLPYRISESELEAMGQARDLLATCQEYTDIETFDRLYLKLSSLDPDNNKLDHMVHFYHLYQHRSKSEFIEKHNKTIRQAIRNNQKIRIRYKSNGADEARARVVHPYDYYIAEGASYFEGYCEWRKGMRTFKLVRIEELEVLDDTFLIDESLYRNKDRQGVFYEKETVLVARFYYPINQFVKEIKLGQMAYCHDIDKQTVEIKTKITNITETFQWIFGFGSKAKIMEPAWLRQKQLDEAKRMLGQEENV